jgi:Flp pilus assembly protein TadG
LIHSATPAATLALRQKVAGKSRLLSRSLRRRREARQRRPGVLTRLFRSRSGVTLVEFALVAPLFLLLVFAIADNGLVLLTQSILDNATREAARQIRLGQVQSTGDKDGNGLFKATLCKNLDNLISCNGVQWNVQSADSFATLRSVGADSDGRMASTGFSPGSPQSFVLVQVGYTRHSILPFLDRVSGATGNLLLLSTVVFQNEPLQ